MPPADEPAVDDELTAVITDTADADDVVEGVDPDVAQTADPYELGD
jgi:hypothetical protein